MINMSIKSKIISEFGGLSVVARICGITHGAVSQWDEDHIPARHMPKLVAAAPEYGVALTASQIIGLPEAKSKKVNNN